MSDDATGADQTTNEILAYEISDDALENAASIGRAGTIQSFSALLSIFVRVRS